VLQCTARVVGHAGSIVEWKQVYIARDEKAVQQTISFPMAAYSLPASQVQQVLTTYVCSTNCRLLKLAKSEMKFNVD